MKAWAAAILPLLLASCGSIDSIPLDVKGESALKNVEHGIRYYQPAPYLIVMELPATKPPPETGTHTTSVTAKDMAAILQGIQGTQPGDGAAQMFSDALSALAKGGSATPSGSPSSQAGQNTGAQQPQSTGPSSSSSDTSFSGTAATYVVKLVYLPDLSHPYALQMKPGLFNAVSMQPTLVDGWMFSSLNGSVDNTALPAAIASAIGGGSGGSKSSGTSGSSVAAKAATAAMVTAAQKAPGSVTPTDLTTTGTLVGAGEALPVDAGTLSVLNTAQIAAYLGAMANAMGARQISQATLLRA